MYNEEIKAVECVIEEDNKSIQQSKGFEIKNESNRAKAVIIAEENVED